METINKTIYCSVCGRKIYPIFEPMNLFEEHTFYVGKEEYLCISCHYEKQKIRKEKRKKNGDVAEG